MDSALRAQDSPEIVPGLKLRWEDTQQAYVLLYPEGVVKLNATAAEILKRCDGARTVEALIGELQHEYPDAAALEASVWRFLEVSHDNGWIRAKA
jgi:pyrroloquinoline quinone biosynthesis protein D